MQISKLENIYLYPFSYINKQQLPFYDFKLIFLIDVSDSIKNMLPGMLNSISNFIDNLDSDLEFSVFTYSDDVKEVFPFINKQDFFSYHKENFFNLQTSAGTNLYKALSYLYDNLDEDCVYLVVHLTDGYPTDEYGKDLNDFSDIYELARSLTNKGIYLTSISLLDPIIYSPEFLVRLGDIMRGNFYYIKELSLLSDTLKNHISQLKSILFKRCNLYLKNSLNVEFLAFFRVEPSIIDYELKFPINLGFSSFNIDYKFLFKLKYSGQITDRIIFDLELNCDGKYKKNFPVKATDLIPFSNIEGDIFKLYLRKQLYNNTRILDAKIRQKDYDTVQNLIEANKDITRILDDIHLTRKVEVLQQKLTNKEYDNLTIELSQFYSNTKNTKIID